MFRRVLSTGKSISTFPVHSYPSGEWSGKTKQITNDPAETENNVGYQKSVQGLLQLSTVLGKNTMKIWLNLQNTVNPKLMYSRC